MSKLLPTFLAAMVLAACSHFSSKYDKDKLTYQYKECMFYIIMAFAMILFVGLRTRYNDTGTYLHSYELIDPNQSMASISWAIGDNPGFSVINLILKRLNVSPQSYLMIYAAVTISIYLWFIRKYTNHIWLSIFLYVTAGSYLFNLAAIKQCIAVAFCLVGVDRAIKKKWVPFVLWVLLGTLFHPYSLMYLIVPVLRFRPWSKGTYWLIAVFLVLGPSIQSLMGTVIDITTMLGEEYDATSFAGEGVNPFRLAVVSVPILLSFLSRKQIAHEDDPVKNLMLNLTMMNGLIMFVALFGTANYFARLANYFVIFQVITLPWLFTHYTAESRKLLTGTAVVAYFAYFYYGNVINQPFDTYYDSVTLMEYLRSLF